MRPSILLVANYDSDVGYAWWLMESYWVEIANNTPVGCPVHLAYPKISAIPEPIAQSSIVLHEESFDNGIGNLYHNLKFLRKHRVANIYFTDRPFFSLRFAIYRLVGVRRIVVHDHTPGVRTPASGLRKLFKTILARMPLFNADAVFATTEYVRKRHIEVSCILPARCHVVTNGIPQRDSAPKADLRTLFGIPEDRVVLVTVGRASRYKGIDFALQCVARLTKLGSAGDIHYLLCGDGPDLNVFQELCVTLGISDRVTFAGRRDDVPALLSAADLAIHPSSGEVGYSLSILEYMQAGLPVVVPDNPSVCGATVHGKDGLIYREGDIDSAALAVERLCSSKELRQQMGAAAKRRVAEHFNLEKTHRELLAALIECGVLAREA